MYIVQVSLGRFTKKQPSQELKFKYNIIVFMNNMYFIYCTIVYSIVYNARMNIEVIIHMHM